MTDQAAFSDITERLRDLSKRDIKVLEASDRRIHFVSGRRARLRVPSLVVLGIWLILAIWLIDLELYALIVIGTAWLALGIIIGNIKSTQISVQMDRETDLIRVERIARSGQVRRRTDRRLSDATGFQFRLPILRPSALRLSFRTEFPVTLADRAPRVVQREMKAWIGKFLGL
ncbi:hypothetical protein V8J82_10610 [Gymnodinialimonas sp. 2305UL16-5]|uniref:hypothetical protein n=1 Tax=Gymnodinialimonas mytili TaxID=3126503 RepID=UPI0030A9B03C